MIKFLVRMTLILNLLIFSQQLFAAELDISIKNPAPVSVPQHGKVSLFYVVNNLTNTNQSSIHIKKIPTNVSQVTCDPNYCGASFTLGPHGTQNESCILKLTVKAPVTITPADLLLCTSNECDGPNTTHAIAQGGGLPFIGINAGSYSNHHNGIFPLLAASNDSGLTWTYPTTIFQNLKNEIDPRFENGVLSSASCNSSFDKSVCISAGQWCAGTFCDNPLPLIAVGKVQATVWFYPKSVFENLTTLVDPNFIGGSLRSSSCFGSGNKAICIAGGTYSTASAFLPLLAHTDNGGSSWTYPSSIFQNLTTAIDPEFKNGSLFATSCTKSTCDSVCVTAGNFCKTTGCDRQFPLLAVSTDKGVTWKYPAAIHQDLEIKLDPTFRDGFFVSASCAGTGNKAICTSVGSFTNSSIVLPLLALTRDGGTTWTYPPDIFQNLATVIGHSFNAGIFNATSCSGQTNKTLCIAVGSYFRKSGAGIPWLALTKNGGLTWSYPDFIYTKLKTLVDPDFVGGTFDGASCIGSGKTGICVAAGNYCRKDGLCFPLIARSANGGKTWSYPPSVYSNLLTIINPNFTFGFFSDISCKGTPDYNFCMASGQFSTSAGETFPLVAISHDSGNTWTYPAYLYTNLTTIIDPDLAIASFVRGATGGGEFKFKYVDKYTRKFYMQYQLDNKFKLLSPHNSVNN